MTRTLKALVVSAMVGGTVGFVLGILPTSVVYQLFPYNNYFSFTQPPDVVKALRWALIGAASFAPLTYFVLAQRERTRAD